MPKDNFFEDPREQSLVKSEIVRKYFWAWAKVITSTLKKHNEKKIVYIDLFAGPGRYEDDTKSTPLLVLEAAIADKELSQMLVTIFNDKDPNNAHSLEKTIDGLVGIEKLKYKPRVLNIEIDSAIVDEFKHMRFAPTLLFVDPWGYKGLSLRLVDSVLNDWGCDCIFFFNYNRINMGLNNEKVRNHMKALFGEERADELRDKLSMLSPRDRELMIVEELVKAFMGFGYPFVLPFRFRNNKGNRTSHHLIFITKNFRGYEIMKEIMAKESSNLAQGVASFEYNPADRRMPLLFELARPIDDLKRMLLNDFSGRELTVKDLYEQHSIGKPYIKRNYKEVLKLLEADDKIIASPSASERPKGTCSDKVVVTFPKTL